MGLAVRDEELRSPTLRIAPVFAGHARPTTLNLRADAIYLHEQLNRRGWPSPLLFRNTTDERGPPVSVIMCELCDTAADSPSSWCSVAGVFKSWF